MSYDKSGCFKAGSIKRKFPRTHSLPIQWDTLDKQMDDEVEVVDKFLRNHRPNLGKFPFFRKCEHLQSIVNRYVTVHFMFLEQESFYNLAGAKGSKNSDYMHDFLLLSQIQNFQNIEYSPLHYT